MDGTKGLVKVGCCPRALDMSVPWGQLLLQSHQCQAPSSRSLLADGWGCRAHPTVRPSFLLPPPHLPPAAAAAAALRRVRTPQCKDCSSITFGARQGLANFSDGYIVQLDSLLAQASPHVSNSSSVPQLNTASAPYTPTLSLFLAHVSLTPCVVLNQLPHARGL